jgi:hypothetical protein
MDEIRLFTELQPLPPLDAPRIREAARARLAAAMSGPVPIRRPGVRRVAMAGAVAVAAAVALAVTSLLPGSHRPGRSFSVVKLADGYITVTINQLDDAAGLQQTLRADGVPANVYLGVPGPQWHPPCTFDPRIPTDGSGQQMLPRNLSLHWPNLPPLGTAFSINPSAIPSGDVLAIVLGMDPAANNANWPSGTALQLPADPSGTAIYVGMYLAQPSQQCPGS